MKHLLYSISNGKGSTKVFIIKIDDEKVVTQITINFRHDVRSHVEDVVALGTPTEFHNGYYSTDMIFRKKSK